VTTIIEEEVTCAVCGMKQTVQEMGSTSSFGAMDLDTRPPPLRRSTMHLWVHECGECGYVAPELGAAAEGAGRIVASADYRAELKSADRTQLANRMVCRSLLDVGERSGFGDETECLIAVRERRHTEVPAGPSRSRESGASRAGEFVTAGWRRLHAAWVCDDANATEEARSQRRAALALLERALASGQRAMKSVEGGDEVLLADIARRAAEFENALRYCDAGLAASGVPEFVRKILEFERALVRARDVACHSVGEVEETSHRTVH
jgi:hypothetical protein